MSGRRIGSGRTVVISQIASAIVIGLILLVVRPSLDRIPTVAGWLVVNAFLGAAVRHLVSRAPARADRRRLAGARDVRDRAGPAGGRDPRRVDALAAMGAAVTIAGAVLTSTDLRELRSETRTSVPGLPWAVVSTLLFGVATYVMGWSAQEAGSSLAVVRTDRHRDRRRRRCARPVGAFAEARGPEGGPDDPRDLVRGGRRRRRTAGNDRLRSWGRGRVRLDRDGRVGDLSADPGARRAPSSARTPRALAVRGDRARRGRAATLGLAA